MERTLHLATAATVTGGAAWLAKVAVIVATDGRVTDTGAAALLFAIGGLLLVAGVAGLAAHQARRRPPLHRAGAAVGGAVAVVVAVVAVAALAGGVVPDRVPVHLADEVTTVVNALGWPAIALSRWRHRPSRVPSPVTRAATG